MPQGLGGAVRARWGGLVRASRLVGSVSDAESERLTGA